MITVYKQGLGTVVTMCCRNNFTVILHDAGTQHLNALSTLRAYGTHVIFK